MRAMSRAITLLLSLLLISSCSSAEKESPTHGECKKLETTFFRQPVKNQLVKFSSLDISHQYAVFICGNQYMEPPAQYLAEPFSKRGESAIHFLKERLEITHSPMTIRDIVYVLSEISWRKTYNVIGDQALMQLMTNRASEIQDDFWRKYTQQMIADMSKDSK